MARPQKDGLDYFSHDVYASSDEKIEPLLYLYGAKGYAFYFLHLEYIYRNNDLEMDVSDAETRQVLCQKLHINEEEYQKILESCLKKCFDRDYYTKTGKLTSNGIKKRAKNVFDKRERMRTSYEESKNDKDLKESKENNSKEKNSKVKEKNCGVSVPVSAAETKITSKNFIKPTIQEIKTYCQERKNNVSAERFFNFYEAKGWMIGKNKMKDWKAAVRTWEQKDNIGTPQRTESFSEAAERISRENDNR